MLFSKRLFQKKLQIGEFGFIIKESSSSTKFIIGLLILIFGVQIAIWGFILSLNN